MTTLIERTQPGVPGTQAIPRIAIIAGSARPGRKADTVAAWAYDIASRREDATFEVVDLADYQLHHLDEPMPARTGQYTQAHTHAWAKLIGSFDGYVFVTPEYNASISGALKNAIDFLFAEWNGKAAGFIGYGIEGGTRAIDHLRLILNDLGITCTDPAVRLTLADDFVDYVQFTPDGSRTKQVEAMLDTVIARAHALQAR